MSIYRMPDVPNLPSRHDRLFLCLHHQATALAVSVFHKPSTVYPKLYPQIASAKLAEISHQLVL